MDNQNDLQNSISYWLGYIEEANNEIDSLTKPRGEIFKKQLRLIQDKRRAALKKIQELATKSDALLGKL